MQFIKHTLILSSLMYVSLQIAAERTKKGGTLGLSIKGGVITIAGNDKAVSPADNVQALATIPESPTLDTATVPAS